jgi:hypothetical protein
MTSDGVAPVLHSLFDQPGFASPQILTADVLWTRAFDLPWSSFSLTILKSFLKWCQLLTSGTKSVLLARCLKCITWATLHSLSPQDACQILPEIPLPNRRWSFSRERSHHLISLEELSSAPPAYLTELATSLSTLHAVRHETIEDTWQSLSLVEQLETGHLHSASMVAGESPATNAETRVLEDDNLNIMSPIGDDECLFSSFAPDASVSVISLAICGCNCGGSSSASDV